MRNHREMRGVIGWLVEIMRYTMNFGNRTP